MGTYLDSIRAVGGLPKSRIQIPGHGGRIRPLLQLPPQGDRRYWGSWCYGGTCSVLLEFAGPNILQASPPKERQIRLQKFNATSRLIIICPFQRKNLLPPCDPAQSSMHYLPASRKFDLDADKIAKLDAEDAIIPKSQYSPLASKNSSYPIPPLVVWLCTIQVSQAETLHA
ncbi:hypothetical protein PDIDSM_1042 [Penicillium digitatum]|nr:hypothetical protein PDIDSM_1042 [Penicillium digitatum]